ncbi:MAG: hypothetical protein HUJ53_11435 [Holdemanella sp.]|nr:hypothetical protein [Holdemanella sp.]
MKEKFQRFMAGRYGVDELNKLIFYVEIILLVISFFKRSWIITLLLWVLIIIYTFRAFSRNYVARSIENQKYLKMTAKYRHLFKILILNLKDKTNKYFICPSCSQIVRVPRGRGQIEIKCPACKFKFTKKS